VAVVFATIENHLIMLANNFKKYFFEDFRSIESYEWVRNPFQLTPIGLSTTEEESFIELTTSGEIQRQFNEKSLFEFWAGLDENFTSVKTRALRILLPFSTSYLCETGFSARQA